MKSTRLMRVRVLNILKTNRMRHYLVNMVKSTLKNMWSLPLRNVQYTNEPDPSHLSNTNSVPNVKNTPKYFQEVLFNEAYGEVPFSGYRILFSEKNRYVYFS
jgi:hypothetical protein